ncbi:TRAP transporter small permease [Aurantiacibacter xanthus]|nr:TRAP transporter small permease [Aurantiacibacter xanthus]
MPRPLQLIGRAFLALSALCLALMMGVLCWQVLARYLLGSSPAWAEQFALLLMIWMTFLGTAAGVAEGFHIRVAEGVASLSEPWSHRAVALAHMLSILSGVLIAWLGTELVAETWSNAVPTLPLSRGMVYSVIPVSGVLIALFSVSHLASGADAAGSRGSA